MSTLGYRLGVDLGTTFTSAAVLADDAVSPSMVGLGNRAMQIPSVVFLKEDGEFLVGEAAERRGQAEPDRVAREFKRRLGDRVPILVGRTPFSAQALQARLLRWVIDHVTERQGAPPDTITVTCPANWGPFKRDLFNQATTLAGIADADVVTEPEAVAIHYSARNTLAPGQTIVVYDLGGGTFDTAVLRKTENGFTILGTPEGIEQLGGIDFDEAVFHHTIQALASQIAGGLADDPESDNALARLRRDCVDAKEALSADTETTIAVTLPGLNTRIRLVRDEFQQMIGPVINDTMLALSRALTSAGIEPDDLQAIVLTGGSSRIPLVSQELTRIYGRPLALDTHPKHDVALGATLIGQASKEAAAIGAELPPAAVGDGEETTVTAQVPSEPHHPPATRLPSDAPSRPPPPPPLSPLERSDDGERRSKASLLVIAVAGALVVSLITYFVISSGGRNDDPANSPPTSTEQSTAETKEPRLVGPLLPDDALLTTVFNAAGEYTLYQVDPATGEATPINLEESSTDGPRLPAINPRRDSFTVQYGSDDNRGLPTVATLDGQTHLLVPQNEGCTEATRPTFNADGTEAATMCATGDGHVDFYRISLVNFQVLNQQELPIQEASGLSWHGDSVYFAASDVDSANQGIYRADVSDPAGTMERITEPPDQLVDTYPDVNKAGEIVFMRSAHGEIEGDIFVMEDDSGEPVPVTSFGDADHPTWSPDDRAITFLRRSDGKRQIWIVDDPEPNAESDGDPLEVVSSSGEPVQGTLGPPAWGTR